MIGGVLCSPRAPLGERLAAAIRGLRQLPHTTQRRYKPSFDDVDGQDVMFCDLTDEDRARLVVLLEDAADALSLATPPATPFPDVRTIVEALGFDPTNHHKAMVCPYCNPHGLALARPGAASTPPSVAAIEGEYRALIQFAGAADGVGLARGALAAAAVCLGLSGSPAERIQQLQLAGAIVACEMDRLSATAESRVAEL